MQSGVRSAGSIAPLFLRVCLAVTFIWAGMGKVVGRMPVQGENAAVLAGLGVITPAAAGGTPGDPATPDKPLPPAQSGAGRGNGGVVGVALVLAQATPAPSAPAAATTTYSAADFPEPVQVRRVYGLSLAMWHAAHPAAREDGVVPMALWPRSLGEGNWPVYLAWAVALTELIGGVLVGLGMLTRLAAFGLACVMLGAIWLTEIGPAAQSGSAVLGFLPDYARWESGPWKNLLWQFSLLCSALALVFSGAGTLAVDRMVGRRRNTDDDSL